MFKWLKSLFVKKKKPEEVSVHFRLPNGKEFDVKAIKPFEYQTQTKCKIHWEYQGLACPTNNCNVCWQMYAEKVKNFK